MRVWGSRVSHLGFFWLYGLQLVASVVVEVVCRLRAFLVGCALRVLRENVA